MKGSRYSALQYAAGLGIYLYFFWLGDPVTLTYPDWTRIGDILLWFLILFILSQLIRSKVTSLFIFTLFAFFFSKASEKKIEVSGGVLMPGDLTLALKVFGVDLSETPPVALIGAFLLVATIAVRYTARLPRKRTYRALLGSGALVIFLLIHAIYLPQISSFLQMWEGYHRRNAFRSGPLYYYIYTNFLELRYRVLSQPSCEDVYTAIKGSTRAATKEFTRRPVYIILLESLFDLNETDSSRYSQDPWHPSFRSLFNAYGSSMYVGTRGGGSASTEFEILCGIPSGLHANTPGAEFGFLIQNDLPCLPRILREEGYMPLSAYPSTLQYFNEQRAYGRLGFQTHLSLQNFRKDDMDGDQLSDETIYAQLFEKRQPESDRTFIYGITTASHYPFHRDAKRRPDIIKGLQPGADKELANRMYYSTKEFVEFAEDIQKHEPEALIVGFGDHRPIGHIEVGRGNWTVAHKTPVILLGFKEKHSITLPYQVPAALLQELGVAVPLSMSEFQPSTNGGLRPLCWLPTGWLHDNSIDLCTRKVPVFCPSIKAESERLKTLSADLLFGKQCLLNPRNSARN